MTEIDSNRKLRFEPRHTEGSGRPVVLLVLDMVGFFPEDHPPRVRVLSILRRTLRETDFTGCLSPGGSIWVILTERPVDWRPVIPDGVLLRIRDALSRRLTPEQFRGLRFSHQVLVGRTASDLTARSQEATGPLECLEPAPKQVRSLKVKRAVDVAGALIGLVVLSPVLIAIACAVKATSPGPVLFRQRRVGRNGATFTMLKFRSMHTGNQTELHHRYVRDLIAGKEFEDGVFKIANDPRVTSLGGWLRRTSLDELPQLFNVLRGEMSLVGPRPPLPYEVEAYEMWHLRRIQEVKPGMTGLWQVSGRSRIGFDDMVRLDLQYARRQSLWLDLKILLRTPKAVLTGEGAY